MSRLVADQQPFEYTDKQTADENEKKKTKQENNTEAIAKRDFIHQLKTKMCRNSKGTVLYCS